MRRRVESHATTSICAAPSAMMPAERTCARRCTRGRCPRRASRAASRRGARSPRSRARAARSRARACAAREARELAPPMTTSSVATTRMSVPAGESGRANAGTSIASTPGAPKKRSARDHDADLARAREIERARAGGGRRARTPIAYASAAETFSQRVDRRVGGDAVQTGHDDRAERRRHDADERARAQEPRGAQRGRREALVRLGRSRARRSGSADVALISSSVSVTEAAAYVNLGLVGRAPSR